MLPPEVALFWLDYVLYTPSSWVVVLSRGFELATGLAAMSGRKTNIIMAVMQCPAPTLKGRLDAVRAQVQKLQQTRVVDCNRRAVHFLPRFPF